MNDASSSGPGQLSEAEARLVELLRRKLGRDTPVPREQLLANGFRGRPVSERELLEVERAVALAAEGLSQKQIGWEMGLDSATISRRLKRARKEWFWMVDGPFCTLPAERLAVARAHNAAKDLAASIRAVVAPRVRGRLLEVHVVHTGDSEQYEQALPEFAVGAAAFLLQRLSGTRTIGVAWGATVARTIQKLAESVWRLDKGGPTTVFPLSGETLDISKHPSHSASNLAARLHKALNDVPDNPHTFVGIPAAIPEGFTEPAQIELLREFFATNRVYSQIFADAATGICAQAGGMLTGISAGAPWLGGSASESARLEQIAVGNVAGVLLPCADAPPEAARELEEINRRWTGAGIEQLRACAERAARDELMGVVVLAFGPKEEIVLEAIRQGIVSRVVVDHRLLERLERRLSV